MEEKLDDKVEEKVDDKAVEKVDETPEEKKDDEKVDGADKDQSSVPNLDAEIDIKQEKVEDVKQVDDNEAPKDADLSKDNLEVSKREEQNTSIVSG